MANVKPLSLTRDSNELIKLLPSARTLPPFLCQCFVLLIFKAKATRIWRKSKQTLESPRIELETSSSEGRALTNWATPASGISLAVKLQGK